MSIYNIFDVKKRIYKENKIIKFIEKKGENKYVYIILLRENYIVKKFDLEV